MARVLDALLRGMLWRRAHPEMSELIAEIEAKSRFYSAETGLPPLDPRVLDALRRVPRDRFVPESYREEAFCDLALPIGDHQTISAPFVVAAMTDALRIQRTDIVLEVGTGSGYQAAVLAELAARVYSIELLPQLARAAAARLRALGYRNIVLRVGDGRHGWPEHAPYDAIIVTACAEQIPCELEEQLKVGGRLIAPVRNRGEQWLTLIERKSRMDYVSRVLFPVSFVPLRTG